MLTVFLLSVIKGILSTLLLSLLPLQLLNFVLPAFVLEPVLDVIGRIVTVFVWLFGQPAYGFFVLTVVATTMALPAFHLSVFLVHLAHRIKGVFR